MNELCETMSNISGYNAVIRHRSLDTHFVAIASVIQCMPSLVNGYRSISYEI